MNTNFTSIGLKSGEKNCEPQKPTGNNWKDVDWFLHTWGFLPDDEEEISKLSSDQKNYLILLLLDYSWRLSENDGVRIIKMVQDFLKNNRIGDYFN